MGDIRDRVLVPRGSGGPIISSATGTMRGLELQG